MNLDAAAVSNAVAELLGVHGLVLVAKPQWSSRCEGYREAIRRDLGTQIANFLGVSSSISHSQELGGYAFLNLFGWQVGFDIETSTRATAPVARRICQDDLEFSQAPLPAALWCAKEASFKSLRGPLQPLVVAEVRIKNWVQHGDFWVFDFESTQANGRGLSWADDSTQLALAFVKV